jgi:hypothetical protein
MTSPSTTLGIRAGLGVVPARKSLRWFYVGMATAALITVLAGFAPSFYLRPWKAMSPLGSPVVAHGIAFTSWVFLFLVQTLLVAAGHTGLHRRLGMATTGLAAVMIISAPPMAVAAAARGGLPGDPLAFLLVILVDILSFAAFVGAAIIHRRRPEAHKRLMLLAMASLLGPAISRWPIAVGRPLVIVVGILAFVAAAPAGDLLARRRPHPVSVWGGLALLASAPLRFALAHSEPWHRVAGWLIRLSAGAHF